MHRRADGMTAIVQGVIVSSTIKARAGILPMITAIVRFKLPATFDAAKVAEVFQLSAPRYQGLAGLIRKYYLYDAEGRTGGGCYLWQSREAAERVYNAEWRQMITERRRRARDQLFRDARHCRQHARQDDPRRGRVTKPAFWRRCLKLLSRGAAQRRDRRCLPIRFCGTSMSAGLRQSR